MRHKGAAFNQVKGIVLSLFPTKDENFYGFREKFCSYLTSSFHNPLCYETQSLQDNAIAAAIPELSTREYYSSRELQTMV